MIFSLRKNEDKLSVCSHRKKQQPKIWRRIASAALCIALLGTNTVAAFADETPAAENTTVTEETIEQNGSDGTKPDETNPDEINPDETIPDETKPDETNPDETKPDETTSDEAENAVYTLYLTHYFRFTVDGKGRSVQTTETLKLTEADFENGVCDLSRFAQNVEQLTVTEANPVSLADFDENGIHKFGARIVYAVSDGWRVVYTGNAAGNGTPLRDVFQGSEDGSYEFVPANVVVLNMKYKYSNTGGLAGIDAAAPETVQVQMEENNGSYTATLDLPTAEGFRIVLNPDPLNQYLVKPPAENATPGELAAALDRGDFSVDIDKYKVYYYQEVAGQDTHPTYQNRYSTDYNNAWNTAREFTGSDYTAKAVDDNNNHGANPLENPQLQVTLTKDQLDKALNSTTPLEITVYYRRNATWYTVNHWVPNGLSGLTDFTDMETKNDYVRLDQEILQGRVGAMTNAQPKTDGTYQELTAVGFSQKLIENTNTAVDIYYKTADSYRIIFDTDYTYIPRQQVEMGKEVDFSKVTAPTRTGYTFGGWRYLKKDTTPDVNGNYQDTDYIDAGTKETPTLTVNNDLIAKAKLQDNGGVVALHLYPKWIADKTQVRVILWTENLTGEDDVQATAEGGNSTTAGNYYATKYAKYSAEPVTHKPVLNQSDSNYSNAGSFTVTVDTDASLLDSGNSKALLGIIQTEVTNKFNEVMGQASDIDVAQFYAQDSFKILHEADGQIDDNATTASSDGKTTIYVYFTRNIYELKFTYYGTANGFNYAVATNTNGYSWGGINDHSNVFSSRELNFAYIGTGNNDTKNNKWVNTGVNNDTAMPVPKTITIKAKYGADLRDVWPVARAEERAGNASMISWATTQGKYCKDGQFGSTAGSTHDGEPTIMGVYAAMGSEIIADPSNKDTVHHLVAYWWTTPPSYYRYNHCYEVPELNVSGMQTVSIYNNSTDVKDTLYLVPTTNETITKYGFNDLMKVSYVNEQITYNDPNGTYYAVRQYTKDGVTKYYAVARQVTAVSTNTIAKQNPSARLHMTRANDNADHSTEYTDDKGATNRKDQVGTADAPYDLYFYYDRDRYTITYMAPSNNITTAAEVTLGTVTLPFGAQV